MENVIQVPQTNETPRKRKKRKFGVFDVVNYTLLTLFGLVCIFPVLYELTLSVSSKADFLLAKIGRASCRERV